MKTLKKTLLAICFTTFCQLLLPFDAASQANRPGPGNALNFGGGLNIVSFGNPVIWNNTFAGANKKFTISLWLYANSLATAQMVLGKFADGPNCSANEREILMSLRTNGALWFGYYMNDLIAYSHRHISTPAGAIAPNKWIHVAVTYDGTFDTNNGIDRVQIYLNGIAQTMSIGAQTGTFPGDIIAAPSPLVIGAQTRFPNTVCNSLVFDGQVDELHIWNRVLTQTEIKDNMCQKLTGTETDLIGYWRFDESSGNTAFDSSPNGNDGTLF